MSCNSKRNGFARVACVASGVSQQAGKAISSKMMATEAIGKNISRNVSGASNTVYGVIQTAEGYRVG